jgi:hypothetical protein
MYSWWAQPISRPRGVHAPTARQAPTGSYSGGPGFIVLNPKGSFLFPGETGIIGFMSEQFQRITLQELDKIRIVCQCENCNTVIELPTKDLADLKKALHCPRCNNTLQNGHYAVLAELAKSMNEVEKQKDIRIEFVIKQPLGKVL